MVIPKDLRPKTYAAMELVLDILHSARSFVPTDLESIAIYVCVGEATMRPVLANPAKVKELETVDRAPEELRGSITMLQVADRLGMPRETVRRKVKQLIEKGLLYADEKGRIRSTPNFDNPALNQTIQAIHDAVERYCAQLVKYGVNS